MEKNIREEKHYKGHEMSPSHRGTEYHPIHLRLIPRLFSIQNYAANKTLTVCPSLNILTVMAFILSTIINKLVAIILTL